ncbi:MAG: hypothetical protein OCC49_01885 [Fibrobacterales bacterium]
MSQLPWILKLIGIIILAGSFLYTDLIAMFNLPAGGRMPLFGFGVVLYLAGAIMHAVRRYKK